MVLVLTPALPLLSLAFLSESLLGLISLLLVILALLILRGVITTSILGEGPNPEKTNCENCGAQVPIDDTTCSHCGEPLPDKSH